MSMMFIGATPPFKCADGFDANATYASLPAAAQRCHSPNASAACRRWVFDRSVYESTVVTEWALVCGRKPLLSLLQSLLMLGGLSGAVAAGQLADRFGRRPVFLPAMLLIVLMAFTSALATSYALFAACRLLSGLAMALMIGSQYVLVAELGGIGQRARYSAFTLMPFAVGTALVAALSYAVPNRRLLQLVYAVPCLGLLPNIWLMPESPRWLLLRGRPTKAYDVLAAGARWNGAAMPPRDVVLKMMTRVHSGKPAPEADTGGRCSRLLSQLLQLVKTPRMRRNTLVSAFVWFVVSGAYFGIAFDVTQLSRQPHLAGVLLGLLNLPSVFSFPIIDRLGRRGHPTLRLAFGLVGQLSVSLAFSILYAYSPEYMPTCARAVGFGVCQVALRLGATVSPFVVDLVSELRATAPSAVFGAAALLAGLATLLLPETRDARLPDSVADVERGGSALEKTMQARERSCKQRIVGLEQQISTLKEQLSQEMRARQQYILRSTRAGQEIRQIRSSLDQSLRSVSGNELPGRYDSMPAMALSVRTVYLLLPLLT
ncbi:organic cation transporter protein-like [Pollicipes pollicipes]|uniref:organic cation transporter protein-like n=1 Tax=Pollicipes pollicipes TaxID=41117 RepID=UPI001884A4E8|nr:organic cation transporter protein-like [Pollicipes pollicipes]